MQQLKITQSITSRDTQALSIYLKEIAKQPLLNCDEENELALKIKEGDEMALERLIKANLRFVVSVAKQFQGSGIPLIDLINEGNIGLMLAARKFDETRGFKFISYAVWWIRQYITKAIAEQRNVVHFPLSKISLNMQIEKHKRIWQQEYEREPEPAELSEILNRHESEIIAASNMHAKHVSLDTPVMGCEDCTMADTIIETGAQQDNLLNKDNLLMMIHNALDTALTSQQKKILCYYFGIGMDQPHTLEDIGTLCNISRERVRQIKEKAIRLLQQGSAGRSLRVLLS